MTKLMITMTRVKDNHNHKIIVLQNLSAINILKKENEGK